MNIEQQENRKNIASMVGGRKLGDVTPEERRRLKASWALKQPGAEAQVVTSPLPHQIDAHMKFALRAQSRDRAALCS